MKPVEQLKDAAFIAQNAAYSANYKKAARRILVWLPTVAFPIALYGLLLGKPKWLWVTLFYGLLFVMLLKTIAQHKEDEKRRKDAEALRGTGSGTGKGLQ